MIFKTKNPDVVAYARACHLHDVVATIELMMDAGKETVRGKVLPVSLVAGPEPHWEIKLQTH
jgi:hypothetical protein